MERAESKITEAELAIMEVLWRAGEPLPLAGIRAALPDHNGDTTKTLLRRLCRKGAVEQEKREIFYYRPLVSREAFGQYKTRRLIDKLYGGSARAMVAALVEHDQLTAGDVDELRAMLAALCDGKEGG